MNSQKTTRLFMALLGGLSLFWAVGCKKLNTPSGKSYYYQCYWEGGPNDFSPYGDFNTGGILVHHDDTATIQGTWSNVEETVIWTLNNPPRNTRFRGTYDKNGIAGNITDDLGRKAWFQGDQKKK
jgi:hypothetical protein